MKISKGDILLIKAAPDENNPKDQYGLKFSEVGKRTKIIPALDFEFCNLDHLQNHLANPDNFSGIVFTSPRAVKATELSIGCPENLPVQWKQKKVFVVGEATARDLKNSLDLVGEGSSAGNAAALADVILESTYSKPLLFPCGSLKKDILETKLDEGGVKLVGVTVYRTTMHPQLKEKLAELATQAFPEIVVFFSPSGVKFCLPYFQEMGLPGAELKMVAIGPSTAEALKETNCTVWATAKHPNPESLIEAIQRDS